MPALNEHFFGKQRCMPTETFVLIYKRANCVSGSETPPECEAAITLSEVLDEVEQSIFEK
jgi:hypothetical protein